MLENTLSGRDPLAFGPVARAHVASKTLFVGGCVGVATAFTVGGPTHVQAFVAATLTLAVGALLYASLLALASYVRTNPASGRLGAGATGTRSPSSASASESRSTGGR
ncbi:hypothetical protein [Natronobiforma cellulositropha]|uniref:hypothetical protein n=1 Tax=Natronobiforma cellulositropha TaxID=1679076 RepID=UPI0021D5B0CA|nr:hypothetical protein [Natronobiforma cellulositropha]